jgi:hypothetical protein
MMLQKVRASGKGGYSIVNPAHTQTPFSGLLVICFASLVQNLNPWKQICDLLQLAPHVLDNLLS